MSMYNSSNCGLVLPIEKIIPHLPESFQKRINDFINCDSPDPIEVMTVLREFTTADGIDGGILYPDDIFVYDGDEPNDDLEEGKMYAMWSETNNPFYTRQLTAEGALLEKNGLLPKFVQWVTWG